MTAKSVKSVCPYCGVGCGMVLHVENEQVVKITGDAGHPANFGRLCTKGSSAHIALRKSGRLTSAYSRNSRSEPIVPLDMDLAIIDTARRLRVILDQHGPDALSFYVSGQMSIEAQYLVNKLAKGFIGTNNIESNSRLCMASAASGYKLSLGADGPPGSYQDFDKANLFLVIGANMADCHPILYLRMMDRVKAGAKLIVVDPRRNTTADKAHLFLRIRPGTDLALLNGILHLLNKNGLTDRVFIDEYTQGWDGMPAFLDDYTPSKVAAITGIAEADIEKVAQLIGAAPEWMSCWTMGLNQSTHGTWNTNAVCNLHLATGKICRPGSGPFSLTGQPNAMGGREMGYMGPGLPGQRSVLVDEDRDFVERLWQVPKGTLKPVTGSGTIDMFSRMVAGSIKACWIICTNPVASVGNRQNVIDALQAAELVITQDAFLDTETNRYADILLPGALWAEAEGVMINSERNLTLMQKAVEPEGAALPDWRIIARVACEMGFADAFNYASAGDVFAEIAQVSNARTGYDLRGASYERLRETPLQWPCPPDTVEDRNPVRYINDGISQTLRAREGEAAPRLGFPTASGRANFFARPHVASAEMPDREFPIVLNTGRLQHQWHTLTKTGKIPTLNKLNPSPFVELHPEDARALGIGAKDSVEIRSRRGRAVLPAVISDRVAEGQCFAPMHWNDVYGEDLCVNVVTIDAVDEISQQPELKFCAVELSRVAGPVGEEPKEVSDLIQGKDMMPIDTFAALLGLKSQPIPELSDAERMYLAGFVSGIRADSVKGLTDVPVLPASAPFESGKRMYIDGMLAGMFSRAALAHAPAVDASATRIAHARPKVLLLWASQTGNVEALVEPYATRLMESGFEIRTACMSDCEPSVLQHSQYVLLMTSTFGDGDAPDNGIELWQSIRTENALRLDSVRYAVLAFGDRNYDQFCGHGRALDTRLGELGAQRLLDRTECDSEYQAVADEWIERVIKQIEAADAALHAVPVGGVIPSVSPGSLPTRTRPALSKMLGNVRLNKQGATKDTRYFALSTQGSGIEYEVGDALGVWPSNCPELVKELLDLSGLDGDAGVHVAGMGEMPLDEALGRHFEIARPSADALAFIASRTNTSALRELLEDGRKNDLKKWLWGQQLADVLYEFPVALSATELVGMLKRMQPRLYSIASSPKAHEGELHLTVSAVRYNNGRRQRKGVSSTFLADRAASVDVPVFVQKSTHFRPPHDPSTPMIMVGPGTGIAPFRAFLHERIARGDNGRNWLFFGEQHAQTDFYYGDELLEMRKQGQLTRLDLAFSRDQESKIYVQDRMLEQGEQMWAWLQEGAHFYVCGDALRMAKDVDAALKAVAARHGGLSEEKAADYVRQMASDKRYVRDVY